MRHLNRHSRDFPPVRPDLSSLEVPPQRNSIATASVSSQTENGGAVYCDVPPGCYHIAAESFGKDVNQETDVDLPPGQQVYIKILSLRSWQSGNLGSFQRDPVGTGNRGAGRNRARSERHLAIT
jgi:hypothetical protein